MKTAKMLLAALALALILPATQAQASGYPPDYTVCNVAETQTPLNGPFEIIRRTTNLSQSGVTLTVSYRGYLRNKYPDSQIKLYVSLNGQSSMIQASTGGYNDAYIFLNAGPRNCTMCMSYMDTPLCNAHFAAGGAEGVWVCEGRTALEAHLFQEAFGSSGYSTYLKAWNVSVAAEANGEWDSNFGNNYNAWFPEKWSC